MSVKTVDAKTLANWIKNDEAVLIDVRHIAEHKSINIPMAKLIPLDEISHQNLPEIGDKKLVIHCHSGKRGFSACDKLLKENSDLEIYNLEGGILAWQEAKNEVEISKKFFLPLDRQVQLAIGIGVLSGVFLDILLILHSFY